MSAPPDLRRAEGATRVAGVPGTSRKGLALLLSAPITIPVALMLVAAFLISGLAGGGSVTGNDVPATGVIGGTLKGGVPVPTEVVALIEPSVQATGNQFLTESVLAAQLYQESGFNARAVSPVGAAGHRPVHARDLGRARPGRERRRHGRPVRHRRTRSRPRPGTTRRSPTRSPRSPGTGWRTCWPRTTPGRARC